MTNKKSNTGRIKRRGRPTRASASKRALKNVDTSRCDIREQARRIALDESQPGSTRISALRLLAELDSIEAAAVRALQEAAEKAQDEGEEPAEGDDAEERSAVLADALAMLQRNGGRTN